MKKEVRDILNKPYHIVTNAVRDEVGHYYVARVLEFDGCIATGETQEEAHQMVNEVMESYIEDMLEDGDAIPEPVGDDHFSGNVRLRMPKSLHRDLSRAAKLEGVSLNQYLISKLSK
ncbi:type II toxin-antitoxin system HicB family antitoxin [Salisediminibacterium selenitireducens]|uniref:HicB family protein n=1 Tax=Bacillus selenitireducens (strain ATCC 700615 / DSM 15326 / MLS10) TaxID=439292 RepID=D6XWK9_BACIE|nr:type II toxin-antitoxin system HicB family antitoxin [Salisediminibacterium selenitireducens]ADH97851.1 HicB family protein [[Bacillus] selenitireducens MLS10]